MTEKELLVERIREINKILGTKEVQMVLKIEGYTLQIGSETWMEYMKTKMMLDEIIEVKRNLERVLLLRYNTVIMDQEGP